MEVVGRYSKLPRPLILGQVTTCAGLVSAASTIHNVRRRLGAEVITQLVHDYQAGVPSTELTVTYGIGKGTVLRLLRFQGVQLRRQRTADDEIAQAAALYTHGLSLAAIGQHLGRDHTVVWHAIIRAGVPMRDSHGREHLADHANQRRHRGNPSLHASRRVSGNATKPSASCATPTRFSVRHTAERGLDGTRGNR